MLSAIAWFRHASGDRDPQGSGRRGRVFVSGSGRSLRLRDFFFHFQRARRKLFVAGLG